MARYALYSTVQIMSRLAAAGFFKFLFVFMIIPLEPHGHQS